MDRNHLIHFFSRFSGHSAQRKIADVETKNLDKQPKAKNNNIAKYSKTKSDDLKKNKKTEIFSNGGVAGSKRSAAASEQRRKNSSHSSTDNNINLFQTLNVNNVENSTITNNRSFETKKKKKTDYIGDSHLKSINGVVLKCELVL